MLTRCWLYKLLAYSNLGERKQAILFEDEFKQCFINSLLQQSMVNLTGIRKCPGYKATKEGLPTAFLCWTFLTVRIWISINVVYCNSYHQTDEGLNLSPVQLCHWLQRKLDQPLTDFATTRLMLVWILAYRSKMNFNYVCLNLSFLSGSLVIHLLYCFSTV